MRGLWGEMGLGPGGPWGLLWAFILQELSGSEQKSDML